MPPDNLLPIPNQVSSIPNDDAYIEQNSAETNNLHQQQNRDSCSASQEVDRSREYGSNTQQIGQGNQQQARVTDDSEVGRVRKKQRVNIEHENEDNSSYSENEQWEGDYCRGNPLRVCHENEFTGGNGDARGRCAVCAKKTNFFCLDCEQWFCMSTKNTLLGEDKFLQFAITTTGRRRSRKKHEEENDQDIDAASGGNRTCVETYYAYRSCWNVLHSQALTKHGILSIEGNDSGNDNNSDNELRRPSSRRKTEQS